MKKSFKIASCFSFDMLALYDGSGKCIIADRLKELAEKLNVAVIVSTSIKRHNMKRGDSLEDINLQHKTIPFNEWIGNNNIFKQYCDVDIKAKTNDFNRSEIYQGKYTAAYIQKVTNNNIMIELAFFFRDNNFSAWIKCWENGKRHNEKNNVLIEKVSKYIPSCLSGQWERKVYVNRILKTNKNPNEFNSFTEFDNWVNRCISDFNKIAVHL